MGVVIEAKDLDPSQKDGWTDRGNGMRIMYAISFVGRDGWLCLWISILVQRGERERERTDRTYGHASE